MNFLSSIKAERLITQVKTAGDPSAPQAKKAIEKLGKMGGAAVSKLIDELAHADKKQTMVFVELLTSMVANSTFPHYTKGLASGDRRTVSGVAWALSSSRNYNPHRLLDSLNDPEISKPAILDILSVHKDRLNVKELLRHAYTTEASETAALFKIISDISDEELVPDLINRLEGKDPFIRVHLINVLSRFNRRDVVKSLEQTLQDNNKLVRQAAISALAKMDGAENIELISSLLRDPEIDVQNKAIDLVIKIKHPDTVKYLVEVLKDESEYARRAAVEVLNEVGDSRSIKDLLQAIEDEDWWVRSRAADALAKIGGPRVVDAVLELIKDDDEAIRRAAIEILNQTKDERAVNQLIEATKDEDWWVSERAVDALATIGSKKALPRLKEMLQTVNNPKTLPVVIRALGTLGDYKLIKLLLPMLERPEKPIKLEALEALTKLADERRADTIRHYFEAQTNTSDATLNQAAFRAIKDLDARFSPTLVAQAEKAEKFVQPAKTLLLDEEEVNEIVAQAQPQQPSPQEAEPAPAAEPAPPIDISTLQAGDLIEGRYEFIEKIGKGAFGTVVLVEDTVVDERLILKFLNPNVASDEEMMKRFVHELRYSRKITHKNVIRIYDFVQMGGHYAISMEYFPSHTLGSEIVNEKPLPLERALSYTEDIATGMTVAHQVGIVHRDLKPANILINEAGLVKIVDFGVAAAHQSGDTQLTKTGYVIGSPKYMAPEQILGKKVDEKADIYSLGVILYEMLTGVPPYSRGDHMSVMYQHVQGKYKPPREINTKLPEEVAGMVEKAMALDKLKRFQSMEEFKKIVQSCRLKLAS